MINKAAGPSTQGNQQQRSRPEIPIEDINVFWPRGLGLKDSKCARYLVGWSFLGGPGEFNIVIADALNAAHVISSGLHQRTNSESVNDGIHVKAEEAYNSLRLLGVVCEQEDVKGKGKQRAKEFDEDRIILDTVSSSQSVWLVVSLHHPTRRGYAETISINRIDLPEYTPQAAMTILYYAVPHSSATLLEPKRLSTNAPSTSATDLTLGSIFETQIASKPHRWFEVTGGFGMSGPGSGLRRAFELIGLVRETRNRLRGRMITECQSNKYAIIRLCDGPLQIACKMLETVRTYPVVRSSHTLAVLHMRFAQLRRLLQDEPQPQKHANTTILFSFILDILLGLALWHYLSTSHDDDARSLHTILHAHTTTHLKTWTITNLTSALAWLDSWPVGLKLNTELSRFYRDMYTGLISTSTTLLVTYPFPFPPLPLTTSLQLSLYMDHVSLLTCHLPILHSIATAQVRALYTLTSFLLNLFRGHKCTITGGAKRIKVAYELDQLLLGTIGFTLAVFLSPTVLSYAALFVLAVGFRRIALYTGRRVEALVAGDDDTASHLHLRLIVLLQQLLHCVSFGTVGMPGVASGIVLRRLHTSRDTTAAHLILDAQYKGLTEIFFSPHLQSHSL